MALKTYDSKQVSIVFGGFLLSGFAEDRMVTVQRSSETWSKKTGTDGEVTRSKSNDKSGEVTFHLMQTAAANAVLSGLAIADELTNAGVVPLLVKDNSGASLFAAAEAWITKPPEAEFAKEAGSREWVIHCAEIEWFEGGN